MLQAMLASVSSIKAQQSRMNVIGNNLANVNTTAFKGSRVLFQDMLSQTVRFGSNPIQFGQGVLVGSTEADYGQGSLNATNRPGDLALQGNGYFVVSSGSGFQYTRDGAFSVDASGNLIHSVTGEKVLGWAADANGNINNTAGISPTSSLNIPVGNLNAFKQTANVGFQGNLDSGAKVGDTWSASVRVFDSLGGAHNITLKFTKAATATTPAGVSGSWNWAASEGTTPLGSSSTPLNFDSKGNILNPSTLGQITIKKGGTTPADVPISIDFSKVSQISGQSQVQANSQDGFPPGQLQGFSVGNDGIITGIFSNGLTRSLGQVAVASFSNPGGLTSIGANLFQETNGSGPSSIGVAGNNGRAAIQSGFLEQSNVDIGSQFTDLIVTQRGFQANTKVITTVDQMLQDILNVIR